MAEFGEFGSARLVTVGADGAMRDGVNVPAPLMCCTIGPDGVAYGSTSLDDEGLETRTQLIAFDQNGMRPGWPVVVDGTASSPSFGPNGQLVYSSWIDEASRIVRLNQDGSEAGDSCGYRITVTTGTPTPTHRAARSSMSAAALRLVAQGQIYGYDANGDALHGSRTRPKTGLLERGNECRRH